MDLGTRLGIFWISPLSQLGVFALLGVMYPEHGKRRLDLRVVATMVATGFALFAVWFAFSALPEIEETTFLDLADVGTNNLLLGLLAAGVAAPLFEEKVVRHLLLEGFSKVTGYLLGAILVSAVFGLVHQQTMIWAFVGSLIFSAMSVRF